MFFFLVENTGSELDDDDISNGPQGMMGEMCWISIPLEVIFLEENEIKGRLILLFGF